jgi:hypothetical protein
MRVEMEDPNVRIYEKKPAALNELLPLLEAVVNLPVCASQPKA